MRPCPTTSPNSGPGRDLDNIKDKMREALERKEGKENGFHHDQPLREKAHGSEVNAAGLKLHRRKTGGGA